MEEEIIKASGIAIIRAAEKKLAEQAKFKPEVVKLGNLQEIKKRENFDSGSEGEFISQISQEEEESLSKQLEEDDPFGNLESREDEPGEESKE